MPTDYRVSSQPQLKLIIAGSILHRTLTHLGHPQDLIRVHHLTKGTNLHTDEQREKMEAYDTDKVVVLDQGSRPGRSLVSEKDKDSKRVLIVDHHMSDEVSCSASLKVETDCIVSRGCPDPHCLPYTANSYCSSAHISHGSTFTSGCEGEGELESGGGCDRGFGTSEMGNGTMARRTKSGTKSVSPYSRTPKS
jgi:hypothetical protein